MTTILMRGLSAILIVSLLAGLQSCSSNRRKDLQPMELKRFDKQMSLKRQWRKDIGDGPGKYYHQFTLAVDEQFLYAASKDGKVYKYDKQSGRKKWRKSLGFDLTAGVAVDGKHVYIAAANGSLIALNKNDGSQSWSSMLHAELVNIGTIFENHYVVQAVNGEVFNIDTDSGQQRWRFDTNLPPLTIRGTSRPTFFGNYVAVGTANSKVILLDLMTGQLRAEPKVATPEGDTELERVVDIDATPIIDDKILFAAGYQGQLVALDLSAGRVLWSVKESTFHDLSTGFNHVYVVSDNSTVLAYNTKTGDLDWVQENLLRRKVSAASTFSSFLVVADFKGYVHVLSQLSGEIVGRGRVDRSGIRSNILVDGEYFYALANDGALHAYRIKLKKK